ncbi:HAMP domain-containing sensor histidine kinase [Stakelama marina]|nr:HAMP domain-containing sensor histidine kinase [Stakelama marina]
MRLSITARLALLTAALTLVSALTLVGFIWQQTHDDAIGALRRNTIEQSDTLVSVWKSGGLPALRDALDDDAQAGDASLIAEIVDRKGRIVAGAGPEQIDVALTRTPFAIGHISRSQPWSGREVGFAVRRTGSMWLVTGRLLDDWERAQRTIARALFLALGLAVVLGVAGGLIVTRYVTRRIYRIADVVDAVADGAMDRRIGPLPGGGDAFDRLAQQIDGMLDRIDMLIGELRLVTDSVAHDLRSPIARLRARAEIASTAAEGEDRDSALAALITDADLVTRMLATLLEISRSQALRCDTLTLQQPERLTEEIAELYAPVVEEAGRNFSVSITGPPPEPLPLHRELLSQALANLIDNAIAHADGGTRVSLMLENMGGEIRISVGDNGPGIADGERENALRRFGRLDAARSRPGAGLGLSLVQAVARLHGGRLELGDNAPGLVASIILPARRGAERHE